jgi:hypothetical protein
MGILNKIFATGLADMLYRHDFENIGKNQWDESAIIFYGAWTYVCGSVVQRGDSYATSVSTVSIPGAYNLVGSKCVTIWRSTKYKTHEEALGVFTKHVRICQTKFPHLLFYMVEDNDGHKEPKYQEFLDNKWIAHPYNRPYEDDWEPLRSVLRRCNSCEHESQCRKKNEFKCLQLKSIRCQNRIDTSI